MEMEIFAAGAQTDSAGRSRFWTDDDLEEIAGAYDPTSHEAPAVLGHPSHDDPALGWVESLVRKGDRLVARLTPTKALRELVRNGLFKKRSAAFYHPRDPRNPKPGRWYLRHVGFLGAQPPAIKGLPDVAFYEKDGAVIMELNPALSIEGNGPLKDARVAGADGGAPFRDKHRSQSEQEESMNFKECMKSFLNKAIDNCSEVDGAEISEDPVEKRIKEAIRETREKAVAEFMEKERLDRRARRREIRQGFVAEFLETGTRAGRLLPAWNKAGLRKFLECLPGADEETVHFAENGPDQSPFEWMISFLESLPQTVPLGEFAGRKATTVIPEISSASLQLVELAKKRAKNESMAFSEALRKTAEAHPELYEEYALEN